MSRYWENRINVGPTLQRRKGRSQVELLSIAHQQVYVNLTVKPYLGQIDRRICSMPRPGQQKQWRL